MRIKVENAHREFPQHPLPIVNPLIWYPKRLWEILSTYVPFIGYAISLRITCEQIKREMRHNTYSDKSLEKVVDGEEEDLQMFALTSSAKDAVSRARNQMEVRRKVKSAAP